MNFNQHECCSLAQYKFYKLLIYIDCIYTIQHGQTLSEADF